MQIRTIHPFPARMAPELALNSLRKLKKGSIVLDPMAGSGTVLRQAIAMGHEAIGFDMDPLAVLMSQVWTTPVDDKIVEEELALVLEQIGKIDMRSASLPWMDRNSETQIFVDFWFGTSQKRELKRIAWALHNRTQMRLSAKRKAAVNVLRLALSRIIVTKEQSASLARDTSHSRPHKVTDQSDYDVLDGFIKSVGQLRSRINASPVLEKPASICHGDARDLKLKDATIDAVITSPPYLNAIDYLRGHRMSLVWLGHPIEQLRTIRSTSIGAEKSRDGSSLEDPFEFVARAMCNSEELQPRLKPVVDRYAQDLIGMTAQIARVLKPSGEATFVVGNSCLNGIFIKNSDGVAQAASLAGMKAVSAIERDLPNGSRYLPVTGDSLSKRMRTESVMTFAKV